MVIMHMVAIWAEDGQINCLTDFPDFPDRIEINLNLLYPQYIVC